MKMLLLITLLCLPILAQAETSQIVVPVTLSYQGRSVMATMAVDTGATVTTIDTALADELGIIQATGSGIAQMADGTATSYYSAPVDVAVSTFKQRQIQVNIMDYVGQRLGVRGMLGLNYMAGMTMTIDWAHRRIYWSE